jgi:hypothetical protein
MSHIVVDSLVKRLQDDFHYPASGARLVAEKIVMLSPEIKDAFITWWHEGTLPVLEVAGYTLHTLMEEHGMNPIAAFLTLDWLVRDPQSARASLEKGHDYIQ